MNILLELMLFADWPRYARLLGCALMKAHHDTREDCATPPRGCRASLGTALLRAGGLPTVALNPALRRASWLASRRSRRSLPFLRPPFPYRSGRPLVAPLAILVDISVPLAAGG